MSEVKEKVQTDLTTHSTILSFLSCSASLVTTKMNTRLGVSALPPLCPSIARICCDYNRIIRKRCILNRDVQCAVMVMMNVVRDESLRPFSRTTFTNSKILIRIFSFYFILHQKLSAKWWALDTHLYSKCTTTTKFNDISFSLPLPVCASMNDKILVSFARKCHLFLILVLEVELENEKKKVHKSCLNFKLAHTPQT